MSMSKDAHTVKRYHQSNSVNESSRTSPRNGRINQSSGILVHHSRTFSGNSIGNETDYMTDSEHEPFLEDSYSVFHNVPKQQQQHYNQQWQQHNITHGTSQPPYLSAPSSQQQSQQWTTSHHPQMHQQHISQSDRYRRPGSVSSQQRPINPSNSLQPQRRHHDPTHPLLVDRATPPTNEALLESSAESYGTMKTTNSTVDRTRAQDRIALFQKQQQLPPSRSRTNSQQQIVMATSSTSTTVPLTPQHRRASSDNAPHHYRRSSSDLQLKKGMLAAAMHGGHRYRYSSDTQRSRKSFTEGVPSPRTSRGVSSSVSNSEPQQLQQQHSRSLSITSNMSLVSQASLVSIVSDIRRSTFFNGVDEGTGQATMQFPFAYVHLVEVDCGDVRVLRDEIITSIDDTIVTYPLQPGHLYKVAMDEEAFEEYHRVAEDISFGWGSVDYGHYYSNPNDMVTATEHGRCHCDCHHCAACVQKVGRVLPTNYHCLAIEDNLYKRIMDEICEANRMPFGIFFCGHHEDVSRPSIRIPIAVLLCVFGFMAYMSFLLHSA